MGYDAFIAGWRLLSADPALRDDDQQIELRLRPFKSFERYQRNRYIDTMVAAGLKPSMIYDMVRQDLGEKLSYRHIKRLSAQSRQKLMAEERSNPHQTGAGAADRVSP